MSGNGLMTVGELSRRTGTPVKAVRAWTDMGPGLLGGPQPCRVPAVRRLAAAWLRARRRPAGLRATGPAGHALNAAVFAALYATPWYAPRLGFTSDAALLFYGASMLLAAVRGYAGCEVLAVPNWLLRRDDQVGCVLFAPVDAIERGRRDSGSPAARGCGLHR